MVASRLSLGNATRDDGSHEGGGGGGRRSRVCRMKELLDGPRCHKGGRSSREGVTGVEGFLLSRRESFRRGKAPQGSGFPVACIARNSVEPAVWQVGAGPASWRARGNSRAFTARGSSLDLVLFWTCLCLGMFENRVSPRVFRYDQVLRCIRPIGVPDRGV